ncbi:MFS general substrate transporter [Marasmius fiardii PR-910]|nr:MFS general substrate transporter [Marasmius fiardii PR-910]
MPWEYKFVPVSPTFGSFFVSFPAFSLQFPMSTTLIATPADYCQKNGSGLRERRWSVNPPLPQNPFGSGRATNNDTNDSAIEDEPFSIELPPNGFAIANSPILPSPLSNVHMSGYSTNVYIPRHQSGGALASPAPSASSTPFLATPASELPPSTPVDRSGSIIQLIGGEPVASPPPSLECVRRRLACAYFAFFLCGWGDGVTGTVLPYLKAYFQMSDLLTSSLFCGGTVGFFLGTFTVEPVMHRLGLYYLGGPTKRSLFPAWLQKNTRTSGDTVAFSASQSRYLTLVLGSIVHSSFFVLMGIRQGFGTMFVAYATAALARSFLTASLNEFLASGPKEAMGYAYGLWSIGGVFAPLVCQSIIASGAPWQNFYYGSLVVSALNFALVLYAFRPTQRELFTERKEALSNRSPRSAPGTPHLAEDNKTLTYPPQLDASPPASSDVAPPKPENTFWRALCLSYTWAFSTFGWLYCGSETVAQGYTVSYLLAARNADPKTVGYVTSGFAGGLSVGRLLWGLTFTQQKHALSVFMITPSVVRFDLERSVGNAECSARSAVVALALHVTVLVVDSSLQNSIATAIIGLMYGPIWPGALTIISLLLPGDVRMMVMAIFSTAGNLGTSVFPLIVGAMSSVRGVQSMPYLMIPQTFAFLVLWAMFPSKLPIRSSPN